MSLDLDPKVNASHLKRKAYLYVRQSTPRQVLENTESTRRQYALRQRAVALGWAGEQIIVIDSDLGQSAASADREGFQRLVSAVGMGEAGIVLGLEVSRLARNSADWHRLLEMCALTDTLILDEDGLYDPSHFNDRLLLGLKGTMSEAELHVMQARMRGGVLNKARRGELAIPLPIGLVYDPQSRVTLDPDRQVQESLRLLFATFRRTATACATVRAFREQGLLFPRRPRGGPGKGQLLWVELTHSHVIQILRSPRYAGAYVYGRTRTRKKMDGTGRSSSVRQPREQWHTLLLDAHPGYIDWQEYEENLRRLAENAQAYGGQRRKSPPREGPALLQGLALCGICGKRMTVGYHVRRGRRMPEYLCQQEGIARAEPPCQRIAGAGIDAAIGELLLKTVTPLALEVALAVQEEMKSRWLEADRLRHAQVDRARYEAHLAQRRYLQVDPDHRLVADSLEADWNHKLRALEEAQQAYERQRQVDQGVDQEQQDRILALASDFPQLWRHPNTPDRERKRMVRLMFEDVTLIKGKEITAPVRFKGGAAQTLHLPIAPKAWEKFRTSEEVVREIDRLLDKYTPQQIAALLNQRGEFQPGKAERFNRVMIRRIQKDYGLKSCYDRLREAGMLTAQEMAQRLRITPQTVSRWYKQCLLRRQAFNDKPEHLYEHPGPAPPIKRPGLKLSDRRRFPQVDTHRSKEVQCEA